MRSIFFRLLLISAFAAIAASAGTISLGAFQFDTALFGSTLEESDGGTFRAGNWLNVVNVNPGNPGALTGANFDTGIANIGLSGTPVYTIGYGTPIANGTGDDLGIVAARFSGDPFSVAVSTNGTDFTSFVIFDSSTGVSTGVSKSYYYNSDGPYSADLYVSPVDLSIFGLAPGATITALKITSSTQADLIRVAGFGTAMDDVPEPGAVMLLGSGLLALAVAAKRLR